MMVKSPKENYRVDYIDTGSSSRAVWIQNAIKMADNQPKDENIEVVPQEETSKDATVVAGIQPESSMLASESIRPDEDSHKLSESSVKDSTAPSTSAVSISSMSNASKALETLAGSADPQRGGISLIKRTRGRPRKEFPPIPKLHLNQHGATRGLSQQSSFESHEKLSPEATTPLKRKKFSQNNDVSQHDPNNLIEKMKKDDLNRKRKYWECLKEGKKRKRLTEYVPYDDVLLEELAMKEFEELAIKEDQARAEKSRNAHDKYSPTSSSFAAEYPTAVNGEHSNNFVPLDISNKSWSWIQGLDKLQIMRYTNLLSDFSYGRLGTIQQVKQNCYQKYKMLMKVFDTMPKAKKSWWYPCKIKPTEGEEMDVENTCLVPAQRSIGSIATLPRYAVEYIENVQLEKAMVFEQVKKIRLCEDVLKLKNDYEKMPFYPRPDFSKLMLMVISKDPKGVDFRVTQELKMAFRSATAESPRTDVVAIPTSNPPLKHCELINFYHKQWLNDSIIQAYLTMIQKRSKSKVGDNPSCHMASTFFYSGILGNEVKEHRSMRNNPLFGYDLVFFPLNLNGNHWALCVIDNRHRTIKYYDSLGTSGSSCLDRFQDLLSRRAIIEKVEGHKPYTTSIEMVPKQGNSYDCGIFLLSYAERLARNADFNFDQSDMEDFRVKFWMDLKENRFHM